MIMLVDAATGKTLPGQAGGHTFGQEPDGTQSLTVTFLIDGDKVRLAPSQPGGMSPPASDN